MEKGGKSFGGKKGASAGSYKGASSGGYSSNVPAAFRAAKGDAAGGSGSSFKGASLKGGGKTYGSDGGYSNSSHGSYGSSYGQETSKGGKSSWGSDSPRYSSSKGEGKDSWSQPSRPAMTSVFSSGGGKGGGGFKGGGKGMQGGKSDKGGGKSDKGDGKGKGKAQQRISAGETVYVGVVRSFNPEKKNGFIDCKDLFQQGSSGVYIFQDVLERATPSGAGPGDRVAFFVHWSAKGQPQASSPLIRLKAGLDDGCFALKGHYKAGKPGEFGFIDCADTKEFFGRDVYVNKDLAATLQPGQMVSFSAYLNRDSMPNAEEACVCDEYWEAVPGDLTQFAEVETGKGKGKGMAQEGPGKGGSFGGSFGGGKGTGKPGAPPEPTGRVCSGMIKSFNEVNNYGFIECEEIKTEYGLDVFMHGKEFTGYQVGEWVYFEVAISTKGQPQAVNLRKYDQGEPGTKRQKVSEAPTDNYAAVAGGDPGGVADESYQPEGQEYQQGMNEMPPQEMPDESFSFADMVSQ